MRLSAWVRVALALTAIAWGANQFASMLSVYRELNGFTESTATLAFAAYVIGLVPGLLGAAWVSQHIGKRRTLRPVLLCSLAATALLVLGAHGTAAVFVARVLAGFATGAAMGPGTAWIKELSVGEPVGTGARRATIALSLGFAGGPLVSGVLAYALPHQRIVPYLPHLVLIAVATVLAWRTPELDPTDHETPTIGAVWRALAHRWFWLGIVPIAPWVFGTASMSFVYVAPRAAAGLPATLVAGIAAGLTLGTGVMVQPSVRRLEAHHPGRTLPLGLALLIGALLASLIAVGVRHPGLILLTAPLWGAAYGALMVGGLQLIEARVPLALLAPAAAAYYCLTYVGFFGPWLISLLPLAAPTPVLLVGLAVALVTLAASLRPRRTDA